MEIKRNSLLDLYVNANKTYKEMQEIHCLKNNLKNNINKNYKIIDAISCEIKEEDFIQLNFYSENCLGEIIKIVKCISDNKFYGTTLNDKTIYVLEKYKEELNNLFNTIQNAYEKNGYIRDEFTNTNDIIHEVIADNKNYYLKIKPDSSIVVKDNLEVTLTEEQLNNLNVSMIIFEPKDTQKTRKLS